MIAMSFALLGLALATLGWRTRSGPYRNGPAVPGRRRQALLIGSGAIAASVALAAAGDGWLGVIAWIGMVPIVSLAVMLAFAYRPVGEQPRARSASGSGRP